MRIANQLNYQPKASLSSASPMFMENYERNHLEQAYETTEFTVFWSNELNYLDSEFCCALEKEGHGDFLL